MKVLLSTVLLGISVIFSNCTKSKTDSVNRPVLNAMLGTWNVKSITCYSPTQYVANFNGYIKFNPDLTGNSNINNQYINFTYNLLDDDSTIVMPNNSSGIPDTSVIVILNANQFVYHGKNTYLHGTLPNLRQNGNTLDSLYR